MAKKKDDAPTKAAVEQKEAIDPPAVSEPKQETKGPGLWERLNTWWPKYC